MADIVGNETLRDLWQSVVERKGRRHFLTFQNRVGDVFEYTYAAFDEDVNRIANVFLDLGIEKGDHVALHLHSSPEFLMCLFGLAKIGAVAVPINEQYLADEAEYILENSDAICVVVEPLFYETYQELLARGHYFPKGVVVARAGTESPKSNIDFSSIYTPLGTVEEGQQGIYDFWMMRCEQSAILRACLRRSRADHLYLRHHLPPERRGAHAREHGVLGAVWRLGSLAARQRSCADLNARVPLEFPAGRPDARDHRRSLPHHRREVFGDPLHEADPPLQGHRHPMRCYDAAYAASPTGRP